MNGDIDFDVVAVMKWPEDKASLAALSLEEKIMWYSSQDARQMVFLAYNPEFKRFWKIHYMYPLKLKRFMYKLKAILVKLTTLRSNPFA